MGIKETIPKFGFLHPLFKFFYPFQQKKPMIQLDIKKFLSLLIFQGFILTLHHALLAGNFRKRWKLVLAPYYSENPEAPRYTHLSKY